MHNILSPLKALIKGIRYALGKIAAKSGFRLRTLCLQESETFKIFVD